MQRISILSALTVLIVCEPGAIPQQRSQMSRSASALPAGARATLVGQTMYSCLVYPATSPMAQSNPEYHDARILETPEHIAERIPPGAEAQYFHTGDQLVIRDAKSTMELDRDKTPPAITLSLQIEDKSTDVEAWVDVEIDAKDATATRILTSFFADNAWYSRRPVAQTPNPKIGWSRSDVYCSIGVPDHTNSDDLAGDQMVYFGGKLMVYISPKTDRVVNVQHFGY